MGELRQDPTSGHWVVLAPERGRRPRDAGGAARDAAGAASPAGDATGDAGTAAAASPGANAAAAAHPGRPLPPREPNCPFCPGNEPRTPAEIWRDPPGADWQVRVVPNRFPALAPAPAGACPEPAAPAPWPGGLFTSCTAGGAHEVIIAHPRHDLTLAAMPAPALTRLLAACRSRYAALAARPGIRHVQVFYNQGPRAGASLAHPHAQVLALPVVPPLTQRRLAAAARYRAATGRCLYCDLLAAEEALGQRWVAGSQGWAALCPYAPCFPLEVWILPRRHGPGFAGLAETEIPALARLLSSVLQALRDRGGDPDFNLVLHTAPEDGADPAAQHWFLQVAPRLEQPAGFELGTGMHIVTRTPEEAAALLRGR